MATVQRMDGLEGPVHAGGKYDELLAGVGGDAAPAAAPAAERATAEYVPNDARFELKGTREFERQFAQLYFYRLTTMRPAVDEAARARWPGVRVVRILEVPEEGEVAIVGTLYKEMKLKPSILDEYVKERTLAQQLGRTRFTSEGDRLVLEDDGARIGLAGTGLKPGDVVTGVVAAVRGRVLPDGDFEVAEVCFAGPAPQPPLPEPADDEAQPKYVALVSGLGMGDENSNPLLGQLLVDYLGGLLGGKQERETVARIVHVVVAGGLLKSSAALSQPTAYSSVRQQGAALGPLRDADMSLTELAGAVPVDVMPGAGDPANYSLPQQPLHRCLLPGAAPFPTLLRCTNPHDFSVDGVSFLGTSGQNVDDVLRYSDIDDRSAILERLLRWRHLVPTAPDTLAAYPYYDADPFIISATPHVLFAGGQPAFATALVPLGGRGGDGGSSGGEGGGPGVRVVAVPNFSSTGTIVLVNLQTLEVRPVQFDASM